MDEFQKKVHELGTLRSRHDKLEERLSDLLKKGFRTSEEVLEISRIKWEKRDLKEKILQEESALPRQGGRG